MYRCESDVYDRDGGTYRSVKEFLGMCQECFGEQPVLRANLDETEYRDDDGRLVLTRTGGRRKHYVVYILGGCFKTACGIYLDGEAKHYGHAHLHEVTCKNCLRAVKRNPRLRFRP
jgi:hypothetical protein